MDTAVRRRGDDDLTACVEALWLAHEADEYPMVWPGDPSSWLVPPEILAAWVAVSGEVVLGHIVLVELGRESSAISRLFVVPEAQGRCLAVALVEEASAHARRAGWRLELDVLEESSAAIRLYERLGWTLVEREPAPFTWPDGTRPMQRRYLAPDHE